METPRWITPEEECLFCGRFSPVSSVEVEMLDSDPGVLVTYKCKNPKCYALKAIQKVSEFKARYSGAGFIEFKKEKTIESIEVNS
jgi:hypothetical protein